MTELVTPIQDRQQERIKKLYNDGICVDGCGGAIELMKGAGYQIFICLYCGDFFIEEAET